LRCIIADGNIIAVEVLTEDGWRLPGFTRESCDAITGGVDSVAAPVTWSNGTQTVAELGTVMKVHGGGSSRVQFRIYLVNSSIFGLTLTAEKTTATATATVMVAAEKKGSGRVN
jgi:hypothetical protein